MSDKLFNTEGYVIFDGALGTMIQQKCDLNGNVPEALNFTNSEAIVAIAKGYVDVGADVIYTNTFGANALKLKNSGYNTCDVIKKAIQNAKAATQGSTAKIALDVGPIGTLLQPHGDLSIEKAYEIFAEIVSACEGADLIVFETFSDLLELKTAILAAKENCNLPIFVSMTFESNGRTFTGCPVECFAQTACALGVQGVGINCGLGPDKILPLAKTLCENVTEDVFVFIKANAGLPRPDGSGYDLDAQGFVSAIEKYLDLPIDGFGGCCGTTWQYISSLKRFLSDKKPNKTSMFGGYKACSAERAVSFDRPIVCGERINPTGKKRFQKALMENETDYVLAQAVQQADAGADILDVNVGLAGIDEEALLPFYVKEIQSITDLPLQIDTANSAALERALRCYSGVPIINSVNGSASSLNSVLPLVKKYGAFVIGLTLDEKGIPESVNERFCIAERISKACSDCGIDSQKLFIDALTMTVSSAPDNGVKTLLTVKKISQELRLKTALGVSNVSFGLPMRTNINSAFLTLALDYGLSLAIINPNTEEMMSAVYSFCALTQKDDGFKRYISRYKDIKQTDTIAPQEKQSDLIEAIYRGFKDSAKTLTFELLKSVNPLDIVDNYLIKALDKVGADYESGKLYLPELLQSAQATQCAFEVIKQKFALEGTAAVEKGAIALATVKGDVHDIGKNIVKVVLENYGFKVYDLGKDVSSEQIIDCVRENNIKLVGLSALMTTTLPSMEQAIKAIHQNFSDVKVMVGGAVLNGEYATNIGADFFAKDAKKSADIAKEFFKA